MLSNSVVIIPFLAASAWAAAEPAPAPAMPTPYMMGIPAEMGVGRLLKRQAGYQPTQTACSVGATCAESCGAGYETCNDSNNPDPSYSFYCYNPSLGDTCCSDDTGNSCSIGYYCTKDASGNTWCCPNGMSLAQCQAAYSITGSLSSLPPPTSTSSVSSASSSSQTTTTTSASSYTTSSTSSSISASTSTTSTSNNGTITTGSPSGSATQVVTAAANGLVLNTGLSVIAAGLVALLWAM